MAEFENQNNAAEELTEEKVNEILQIRRGVYSMEPSHFAEVPKSIAEEIINGRKK